MGLRDLHAEAQADLHANEMNVGPDKWDRWVDRVERDVGVFGVDIDGDRSVAAIKAGNQDPCAIGELFDWFNAGWSVGRAVAKIHCRALWTGDGDET